MADARRKHDWQLASTIVWIVAEVNRDRRRRRRFVPDDFNPMVVKRQQAVIPSTVEEVAQQLGWKFVRTGKPE